MDELLRELTLFPDESPAPTVLVVLAVTLLSFVLSLLVVYAYRVTHRGPSYSQGSAHTMVIMAVVTAAVMLIIGSNIARAFSLVGALSVIRFRSAVKDPRDVSFLTVDRDLRYRGYTGRFAYDLRADPPLFPPWRVVLEVKANRGVPRWLSDTLASLDLSSRRLSKYCEAVNARYFGGRLL